MLAYDLIGFQNEEWLESFHHYVARELGGRSRVRTARSRSTTGGEGRGLPDRHRHHGVRAGARGPDARNAYETLHRSADGRKVIIGVDRLDYSKGLAERFKAIAASSRSMRIGSAGSSCSRSRRRRAARSIPTSISASSSTTVRPHQRRVRPCRLGADPLRQPGLSARGPVRLLPRRDVALITPLRDGMNLVAKEYVAAQDPDDPGVLILSRFAGAALQSGRPCWSTPTARTIFRRDPQALDMPREERIRRWEALIDNVRRRGRPRMAQGFVAALEGKTAEAPRVPTAKVPASASMGGQRCTSTQRRA